jgi:hypothetical protein
MSNPSESRVLAAQRPAWGRLTALLPVVLVLASIGRSNRLLRRLDLVPDAWPYRGLIGFAIAVAAASALPAVVSLCCAAALIAWDLRGEPFLPLAGASGLVLLNAAAALLITRSRWVQGEHRGSWLFHFIALLCLMLLKALALGMLGHFSLKAELLITVPLAALGLWFHAREVFAGWPARAGAALADRPSWVFCVCLPVATAMFYATYDVTLVGDAAKLYFFFPKLVVHTGSVFQPYMGSAMFQYMPHSYELLIAYGLLTGSILGAKAIHLFIEIAALALFVQVCRRVGGLSDRWVAAAVALLYGCGQFFNYTSRTSPDALLLPLLCAVALYLESASLMLVPVLLLGFATKYTTFYLTAALAVLLLLRLAREPELRLDLRARMAGALRGPYLAALALLVTYAAAPYLEAFLKSGSPFQGLGDRQSVLGENFPSPYRSIPALWTYLTTSFVRLRGFTEAPEFAYGLYGLLILPFAFYLRSGLRGALALPALFIPLLMIFTCQTRYIYVVVPLVILNLIRALREFLPERFALGAALFLPISSAVLVLPSESFVENAPASFGRRIRPQMRTEDTQFQRAVNRRVSFPSRTFVGWWDYNTTTNTIPFKEEVLSPFRLRSLIEGPEFAGQPVFMLLFPEGHEYSNRILVRCLSETFERIPFDYIPRSELELLTLSRERVRELTDRLQRLGLGERTNWRDFDQDAYREAVALRDQSLCGDDAFWKRLYRLGAPQQR